jgi:cytochrome c biogenesis protein CcmG/thiol:disulfide interchange protein DsbE
MTRNVVLRVALATSALVFAGPSAPRADDGSSLAGLRLPNLKGEMVALDSYLGKGPLVIDFWAIWCKPCLAALPELNALYNDLGPRGVQVVGINEDGQRGAAKVKPFVTTQGIDFPVLLDLNTEARSRLKAVALPTTLLFDAQGKLVHTSFGYVPGEIDNLRDKIAALLPSPPAA